MNPNRVILRILISLKGNLVFSKNSQSTLESKKEASTLVPKSRHLKTNMLGLERWLSG